MDDRPSLRDGNKALKILRERILRLELSPGSVIDENAWASALSMSRTPLREAIIGLISEGLAIRDGRVARVTPLNFEDIPRLYEALILASRTINRLAAENRTEDDLKDIQTAFRLFDKYMYSGDDMQRQEANVEFHLAIARAAHNSYFYDFYYKLLTSSSRLSRACFAGVNAATGQPRRLSKKSDPELFAHVTETSRQHEQMVEAIKDRNIEESDRLAVLHQELALRRIRRLVFSLSESVEGMPLDRFFPAGTTFSGGSRIAAAK